MTLIARSPYPDFFIAGAPRCGTTFMHAALAAHPQVFMPRIKEPHFFSNDLYRGTPGDREEFMLSEQAYLSLFADAPAGQVRGEADALKLFSHAAARRIAQVRPDARIVISLRDPVEFMRSYHGVRYRSGREGLKFAQALEAAPDRARGHRLPFMARNLPMYDYRAVARFSEQLQRYFDAFPREQVLILLLDDIAADQSAAYRRLLAHIGVDPSFEPDLGIANEARRVRSKKAVNLLHWPPLIRGVQRMVPRRYWPAWRQAAFRIRDVVAPAGRTGWDDPDLRQRLRDEYAPEVERLGALVGRDLLRLWGYARPPTRGEP